jgi:pectate lyase
MAFIRNPPAWSFHLVAFVACAPVAACSDRDSAGDLPGTSSMAGTGGVAAGGTGAQAGSGGTAGAVGGAGGSPTRGGASGAGGSTGGAAGANAGGAAAGGSSGDAAGGMAGSAAGESGAGGVAGAMAGSGGASGAGMGGKSNAGSAGAAGGGKGGEAGTGGASSCPATLVGWATVSGDGVTTTTGGGNAAPVRPANATELMDYASDATPRVIEIAGTFNVPRLQINSNKTLIGIGDATINGGLRIRGNSEMPVQNVIVRNLRVNGTTTDVDSDAAQIYFAHHVWIDHCEIWDGPDGNLDMTHAVNWVTVSWTKFRYTTAYQRPSGEDADHRFSSLVGHSDDNASEDDGRLKITFHHNWWAERVIERMPRVRFGQVHVFNNYFASPDNNYCIRAGTNAHLLVEGNYFDGVNSPHEFNNSADEGTAHITARNNVYDDTSGNVSTGGGGTPLTSVPYDATIEPANAVPQTVQSCAGPR